MFENHEFPVHRVLTQTCYNLFRGSYAKEVLQEGLGPVNVDAGDAAIASQHAVHRGWDILPVVLSVGVETHLVLDYVPHPERKMHKNVKINQWLNHEKKKKASVNIKRDSMIFEGG